LCREVNDAICYPTDVEITPEAGIEFEVPANTKIIVKGIDKERVGAYAANEHRCVSKNGTHSNVGAQ